MEGVLVEPADGGRDLLELRVRAGELVAAQGPAAALLDDVARRRAAQRLARLRRRRRPPAFPFGGVLGLGFGTSRSISSRMISSAVRSAPSSSRRRPDSAAIAASANVASPGAGSGLAAQGAQLAAEADEVDRAAHRGAHPHLRVLAREPASARPRAR